EGAGLRGADRAGRHLSRLPGARIGPRAGPPDHRVGGAGHLPGAAGRCAVRGVVPEDRLLMAANEELAVEVRGVVNRFGRQVVHDHLDMQVRRGEVFGMLGSSGSGKSVLLRTILGLRQPQAGSVLLEGEDITTLTGRRLKAAK